MFKCKFSKKCTVSIVLLLAALIISLLLGSYNFLTVNSTATLPNILENLDNMDSAAAPAPTPASDTPVKPATAKAPAPAPSSAVTNDDIAKLLQSTK